MNYRLVELLACPACGGSLQLQVFEEVAGEVVEGALSCKCGEMYPIIESVPRILPGGLKEHQDFLNRHGKAVRSEAFPDHPPDPLPSQEGGKKQTWGTPPDPRQGGKNPLGTPLMRQSHRNDLSKSGGGESTPQPLKKTRESFSYEWSMHDYSSLTWETQLEERKSLFLHYLQTTPGDVRGKLILDAGCGNGTLSSAISSFGVEVVGMDLSSSVVRAQKEKRAFAGDNSHRVHFVQGDVMKPPFRREVFDAIYCDGVLHHTPDTKQGLMRLAPFVKPGGKFFVWLYRKDSSLGNRLKRYAISTIRPLTSRLPHWLLFRLCLLGAIPLLLVVRVRRALGDKSRELIGIRLKAVNLFDTFSVQFDRVHTYQEVAPWFEEAGFQEVADVTVPRVAAGFGFGALGIRKAAEQKVQG